MMKIRLAISSSLLFATVACGPNAGQAPAVHEPRAATVTAPKMGPKVDRVDMVMVVPRPARSIGRLRAVLRQSPALLSTVDAALATFRPFDLDKPILAVYSGEARISSFGLSPETAKQFRASGGADGKCDLTEVQGAPRVFCSVGAPLTAEARALGAMVPPKATSDVHMDMSRAAFAQALEEEGGARYLTGLTGLLGWSGSVTLDLSLDGAPELRIAMPLEGAGAAAAILEAPVAPPPATFLRLPADAEIAAFAHAPAAAEQAEIKKLVLDAFLGSIAKDCSEAERRDARAHVEKVAFTGGSIAVAAGFDRARAEAAAQKGKKSERGRGWALLGFEEPPALWSENVSWLATHDCGTTKTKSSVSKAPARLGLPEGSIEIVERAAKGGPSYMLVVADGARTWLAIGGDEAELAAHARVAVRGAEGATLAGRPGIASLRGPATFGGFFTASALAWRANEDDAEQVRVARGLPSGGRTPIPFRGAVVREGKGGTLSVRFAVEPAAVSDLVALFGRLGSG